MQCSTLRIVNEWTFVVHTKNARAPLRCRVLLPGDQSPNFFYRARVTLMGCRHQRWQPTSHALGYEKLRDLAQLCSARIHRIDTYRSVQVDINKSGIDS